MTEREKFIRAMAAEETTPMPLPKVTTVIRVVDACSCGCGRPRGIAITLSSLGTVVIPAAKEADDMIEMLCQAREDLWG